MGADLIISVKLCNSLPNQHQYHQRCNFSAPNVTNHTDLQTDSDNISISTSAGHILQRTALHSSNFSLLFVSDGPAVSAIGLVRRMGVPESSQSRFVLTLETLGSMESYGEQTCLSRMEVSAPEWASGFGMGVCARAD